MFESKVFGQTIESEQFEPELTKIESLPLEMRWEIALKLKCKDIVSLCSVSSEMMQICNSNDFWFRKIQIDFGKEEENRIRELANGGEIYPYYKELCLPFYKHDIYVVYLKNKDKIIERRLANNLFSSLNHETEKNPCFYPKRPRNPERGRRFNRMNMNDARFLQRTMRCLHHRWIKYGYGNSRIKILLNKYRDVTPRLTIDMFNDIADYLEDIGAVKTYTDSN